MKPADWSLCLIADTDYLDRINLVTTIADVIKQGVALVQLRSKHTDTRIFLNTALQLSKILTGLNIPFIINDRVDIALACKADGVHLGQKDIPPHIAREILGEEKIIGVTTANLEQAKEAESKGADYLGVGPVFPTESKQKPLSPIGIKQLSLIRKQIKIPILAIGGINPQNAAEVMSTGVEGIAVISAVLKAEDPQTATKKLLREIKRIRN